MACRQADGVCWQSHAARKAFLPGFGSSRACRRIRGGLIPEIKAWVLAEGRFLLLATAGGTLLEQAKPRKNRIIFFIQPFEDPSGPVVTAIALRLSTLPWGRALPLLPTRYLPLRRGQAQVGPSQHPAEGLGGNLGLRGVVAWVSHCEKLGEGHGYQAVPPSVPTTATGRGS